jgi:hypothetical protein
MLGILFSRRERSVMRVSAPQLVAILLAVSAVLLGILVPGGPIETRNFSHISPLILGTFHVFLTSLGMGSIALAYFAFKQRRFALWASAFCGISYLAVYLLDLGTIFPVSPDAMPRPLWIIEVLGSVVSVPLIVLSVISARNADQARIAATRTLKTPSIFLILLAALVAVGIIWFATNAAMH